MKELGSIWHKWDLHYHTPESYDYKNNSKDNKQLVDELIAAGVSGVVVTDHHVVNFKRIAEMQNIAGDAIKFLHGIEVTSELGGSQSTHFICVFPENCSPVDIENNFLVPLGIPSNIVLTEEEHQKKYVGYEQIIHCARQLGCLICVHAGNKSNSIENIENWAPSKQELKTKILHSIDILETGRITDKATYDKIVFPGIRHKLPIIVCSDYHGEFTYGQFLNSGTKKLELRDTTWIKSELSFEGLKQIKFEPDLRVKVQFANPDEDKHGIQLESLAISKCKIVNSKPIMFNRDMIAVIGEKGSGKTALLDFAAYALGSDKGNFIIRASDELRNSEMVLNNYRDSQSKIFFSNLSNLPEQCTYINPTMLGELLERDNDKLQSYLRNIICTEGIKDFEENISANHEEFKETLLKIETLEDTIATESDIKRRLSANQKSIDDLQKSKPIATVVDPKLKKAYEDVVIDLEKNRQAYSEINKKHIATVKFITSLPESLKGYHATIMQYFNEDLVEMGYEDTFVLSVSISEDTKNKIHQYGDEIYQKKEIAAANVKELSEKVEELQKQLYSNKEQYIRYEDWKKRYEILVAEQKNILDNLSVVEKAKEEKTKAFENLYNTYENLLVLKKSLLKLYNELKSQIIEQMSSGTASSIEFNPAVSVNTEVLASLIEQYFDGRSINEDIALKFSQKLDELKNMIESNDLPGEKIKEILNEIAGLDGNYKLYGGIVPKFRKGISRLKLLNIAFKDYFTVNYEIKFNHMPIEQLSPGQKGIVLMKILLRLDKETGPLLIDQPEDNLDNKSVYDELVNEFKRIKQKRQLIIATHNPNLVVNTDAEQIIIARYDRGKKDGYISYKSGSLENFEIREEVCKVLEGGSEAFRQREKKYGFTR